MTPTAEPHRCSAEIVKQHRTGAGPDLWTLLALLLRGLGDRPDELPGPLALLERDVSLRDHADEPIVLDNGQPPNLVAAISRSASSRSLFGSTLMRSRE